MKPGSKRKWYTLFSLLLWTQLIFSGGLTVWRYQLITTGDWPVYPSNNSPQLDQFEAFIKSICIDREPMGYISTEYNSFARLNYEFYPHSFYNLSDLAEKDIQTTIAEKGIRCLIYDYAFDSPYIAGRRYDFSDAQYVLRPELTR